MYDVTLEEQPQQTILALRKTLSRDEIPAFLGSAYQQLFTFLAVHQAGPTGPPLARYKADPESFEVTAGVPCEGLEDVPEPFCLEIVPPGPVATTVHTGSYDALPEAFHAVIDWIAQRDLVIAADPWESYLDGPEVAQPRTKVCFPVRGAEQ